MKKIIVRADDLGYSEGVNYGLAKSVRDGIIRTVGVMTNMPAVEHGVKLLEDLDVCYGQHTNICVGKPLTDSALIPSICGPDGKFKSSREYREASKEGYDFVVIEEAVLEIEAQYQRFKELIGRKPSYFEGHAVASENFFKGLEIVAKRHGLKYSGMQMKPDKPMKVGNTDVYMWMESMNPAYDPFKTLQGMVRGAHDGCCDIMVCHPGYLDDDILSTSSLTIPRTKEVAMSIAPATREWLMKQDVKLVDYDAL